MYKKRIESLQRLMEERKLDAYFTMHPENIYYLSGYRGDSGYLLITLHDAYLYTYPLFRMEAEEQTTDDVKVKIIKDVSFTDMLKEDVKSMYNVGIEKNHVLLSFYSTISCALSDKIKPVESLVEQLRTQKDQRELEFMKKAQSITDEVFKHVLGLKLTDMTELELAGEMEFYMKKQGAEGFSFSTIVATGEHSAIPHARPRNVKIKNGTNLLLDFGVYYNGYASDMTRTIFVGKADEEFKKVYNIVLKAQTEAEKGVKEGKKAKEIDGIARKIIEDEGYGEYFIHSLGHGVGIDVHEFPGVSPKQEAELLENMVITIEPGIYLKGKFGVRIEDMGIVKKDGFLVLPKSPKELIEI